MILERANGMFHLIGTRHVWRYELEICIPFEGDCFFIGGDGFVIQDLEINKETLGHQTHQNGVIRCDAVVVALRFEGLLEIKVAAGVDGNHDILVARACSDGEAASVVGEELAEWFCDNKDLVGRCFNGRR